MSGMSNSSLNVSSQEATNRNSQISSTSSYKYELNDDSSSIIFEDTSSPLSNDDKPKDNPVLFDQEEDTEDAGVKVARKSKSVNTSDELDEKTDDNGSLRNSFSIDRLNNCTYFFL